MTPATLTRAPPPTFQTSDRSAVSQVCAWPNLTVLPDGTLLAAIFNQPCHGQWEGDLDGYVSSDGGLTWSRRACICAHDEPATNRMNCAVGLANDGDLVALCGGWSQRAVTPNTPGTPFSQSQRVRPVVCRSSDRGFTWQTGAALPDDEGQTTVPFGDIHRAGHGRLFSTVYAAIGGSTCRSRLLVSDDDGRTWRLGAVIDPLGNETSLLPLGERRWLAVSRRGNPPYLQQFNSDDDGHTWRAGPLLTLPNQITSHLLGLPDGRVLLTYGNRCVNNMGIDARMSLDGSATWSAPVRVADTPMSDCGYPATALLPDGQWVTVYYTQLPGRYQYEMRVAHWRWP
jgi:hypothetical protein